MQIADLQLILFSSFLQHSKLGPNDVPDEKTLMGYGQLSLA
jgi:hypothetical protein